MKIVKSNQRENAHETKRSKERLTRKIRSRAKILMKKTRKNNSWTLWSLG
jgi:hypothetical protein